MSKISDLYGPGDIRYYWKLHKEKQIRARRPFVTYQQFRNRLNAGWSLRDAIYRPQEWIKVKKSIYVKDRSRDDIRKANLIQNDIRTKEERLDHVFEPAETPKVDKEMLFENFFKKSAKPIFRNRFKNLFK